MPQQQAAEDQAEDESDDSDDSKANAALQSTEKTCYICAKSLAGRTRFKDHLGRYWCKECAAADERAKRREEELTCPDCSRVFPEHKLVYFQTTRVCPSCFKEREKALEKKVVKYTMTKVEKQHEWKQLKWLALISGGLIVLATVFQMLR